MTRSHTALAVALGLASGCAHVPAALQGDPYQLLLPDTAGEAVSLAGYRGKVLVLNFFATWCFPCLGEMPLLQELQDRRGAEGVQVVAVGLDREGALVLEPFRQFYKLTFPLLLGGDRFADPGLPFAPVHTLPTTLIIGRDGRALVRWEAVPPRPVLDAWVGFALKQAP